VRSFCAEHRDIFHYEVEHVDQIGQALKTIARVKPKVLVINGGDGTVQAALTRSITGVTSARSRPPSLSCRTGRPI
jgi:diacylglycerol kinase family enzyme